MASSSAHERIPVPTVTTTPTNDIIFQGQPKEALWKSLSVPVLDWDDVGIDCFLGRGAFTHVHKGRIKVHQKRQGRKKTMDTIASTVVLSQSSSSMISVDSSSSSIVSIPLHETTVIKPPSADSELSGLGVSSSSCSQDDHSPSQPSSSLYKQMLCAIKCINPTKTKRKEALLSASNDLLNEALLLSKLSHHENFVNFLGILPQVDDDEENNHKRGTKEKIVKDYVLVLECLDETLSARLKRWRKEQLQMQKQQHEIWMAQELVLEQRNRFGNIASNNHNSSQSVGRGRRLGTGVRNLWRRWNNNNHPNHAAPANTTAAPRRGRWGRFLNREPAAPSSLRQAQSQPPHAMDTRVEDYRELVNAETNGYRWKQMNERMESIALGIVAGMKHMHLHQIVHRDLKPQNIGFDLWSGQVKLFDFGLARSMPYDVQTATAAMYYSQRRSRRGSRSNSLGNSIGSGLGRRRSNSIGSIGRRRSNSIGSIGRRRSNSIGSIGRRRRSNSIGSSVGRRRSNSIGSRRSSSMGSGSGRRSSNGTGVDNNNNIPPNPTIGEVVGTWRYMAPETMRSMGSDYASDVFSFAIMWSEICTLQRPYFNDEDDEDDELIHPAATVTSRRSAAEKKNRYGPYENWNQLKNCILEEGHRPNLASLPKHSSTSDLQMWINQCWDREPCRRPTFDSLHQLLQHYCKEYPAIGS